MVHGWDTYGILMLEAFPKHCLLIGCIGWIKRYNREQRWEWPIVNHNRICELIYFFWNWCILMKMEFPMSLLPKISSLDWLSFGCFGWFTCFYFISSPPPPPPLLACSMFEWVFSLFRFLHTFPGRSIIHRDVKSSNILLDHSMCAKVADFGFSKYAPQEGDSNASLEVRETAGYLDPG